MPRIPAASRPSMPRDYGILDEKSGPGLSPWTHASERLENSRNYWVHTTRPDGRPHVKPVWGIWHEERFYFSTNPKSVTGMNISVNSSLALHLESGDDAVILEGTVETVQDPALLSRLDDAYYRKYGYHLVRENGTPVYELRHRVGFAWLERDFVGTATKYDFSK